MPRKSIGIVDIGSNSVRLMIYDGDKSLPMLLFNEKAACALGQGIMGSGKLNPKGVPLALAALKRFAELGSAFKVDVLDVMATAAVRDAKDGPAFVAEAERNCGVRINILSGEREAKLAALGIQAGTLNSKGIAADLGGGSLDLVTLKPNDFGEFASLPLGLQRLGEISDNNSEKAGEIVDKALANFVWLKAAQGENLYVMGGAWRALAKVLMIAINYPLNVLDNFTLNKNQAINLCEEVSRLTPKFLEKINYISKKRLAGLPLAALLLEKLLKASLAKEVVFSAHGLREGRFLELTQHVARYPDPLLNAAWELAKERARFPAAGSELLEFIRPLMTKITLPSRIFEAAALMADSFWTEHPEYRAEKALGGILHSSLMGMDHKTRAHLALILYFRHNGKDDNPILNSVLGLISFAELRHLQALGLALRIGLTISGGAPSLLNKYSLKQAPPSLDLGKAVEKLDKLLI